MPASTFSTSFVCKGLAAVFLCNRRAWSGELYSTSLRICCAAQYRASFNAKQYVWKKWSQKSLTFCFRMLFSTKQTNRNIKNTARRIPADFLEFLLQFLKLVSLELQLKKLLASQVRGTSRYTHNHVGVLFFMFFWYPRRKQNKFKNWKLHYLWFTPAGFIFGQMFNASFKFGVSVEIWEPFLSKKIELFLTLWELLEKAQTSRIFWETLRAIAKDCEKCPKLVQDVFFVNHQSFS